VLWKTITHRKAVMWAESTRWSGLLRGRLSNLIREFIVRRVDTFVANGSAAAEFLLELGVEDRRVLRSCLPSHHADEAARQDLAEQAGSDLRYLFVGRLIPRKHPIELVRAFGLVLREQPRAHLTIVGDGPLFAETSVAARPYSDRISLHGRLEGARLDRVFDESDILVLPAEREVWGLVVNEALARGLAVVATQQVGAAQDLLDDTSGVLASGTDEGTLARAMLESAYRFEFNSSAREERRSRVLPCNVKRFATDIVRASSLAQEIGAMRE